MPDVFVFGDNKLSNKLSSGLSVIGAGSVSYNMQFRDFKVLSQSSCVVYVGSLQTAPSTKVLLE